MTASFAEYGDAGLLVQFTGDDAWSEAQRLARGLLAEPPPGLVDVLATYRDVFVTFDPLVTTHEEVRVAARRAPRAAPPAPAPRTFEIPVVYGGPDGPDLDAVARELSLTPEELVAWHTGDVWTIRMCASPAGAPMTDGPPPPAPVARRADPRVRVPGGSVAVSGSQCMIYPVDSPGGWRIVGRTPVRCSDPHREPFTAYRPGDRLRFVPILAAEAAGADRELRPA